MYKMLIIGGGSIGKRHLRNARSLGVEDITVVETHPERAAALAAEFSVPTEPSLEAAFANGTFDIALVCSPSIFHLENAQVCLNNNCHVFVEKPLSHTTEGLEDLQKLASEKKRITMVGSNWKFYPLFQEMKRILEAGHIGKVLSARCQFGQYLPDWHPWEDYRNGYSANKRLGGGILLDSHEFDYLTWFMGSPVTSLVCFADHVSTLPIDVEDTAGVLLRFADGAIGEIHLDYTQRFYQRNFEFFGENGSLLWDTNQKRVVLKRVGETEEVFPLLENYDLNTMYVEQLQHFLSCVDRKQETVMPFAKAVTVVRLICAAKESAETKRVISF